ncbi:wax ester/triacylglycerol synthase domain-containing protein, partial [Myxococcus llanfairpwllgwyngyllgogerychwyrndrobwllllantysiliogogogochensis]|uniref:wax ester/triacylglycerol synthase domain-containing protein n=1 Tax=Myxococcus llanfairpwllgwyngyllgogerychwyrndrobwllllantysiliogogogochensis TaxID=2590453 RepID=UPI002482BE43
MEAHVSTLDMSDPETHSMLAGVVGERLGLPLSRSFPLWHFSLTRGLPGGDVLLARLHHCMADGIALARVLLSLTDPVDAAGASEGPVGPETWSEGAPSEEARQPRAPGWLRMARGARSALHKGAELV